MLKTIFNLIPKNHLSYLVGKLVSIPFPQPLASWLILLFAKTYKIKTEEAEKSVREYASISEFFTRKLKPGIRPISTNNLVHPADSKISQVQKIEKNSLIQAKGITYNLSDFLKLDNESLNNINNGLSVTYYLCPTDYHRVHWPVDGEILSVKYVPGYLWPVNSWSVENVNQLFAINERIVCKIKVRNLGVAYLVLVGATNVGKMSLSFEPQFLSNQLSLQTELDKTYENPIKISKGEEMGIFHMGSTVIMVYDKDFENFYEHLNSLKNTSVKMGSW